MSFKLACAAAASACVLLWFVGCSVEVERTAACAEEGQVLDIGFYAFFAPVSYSADEDTSSEGFNTHVGYEADLLTALEAMDGAGLSFSRKPIAVWDDIWLQSATSEYDVVGGGITVLDARTRNAAGEKVVAFTSGHIAFRQSLLVRAEDAERLASHDRLTSDVRVGALAYTTGEARMLVLTGLTDADGALAAGTRVETRQGEVVADGSPEYFITAAGESPASKEGSAFTRRPSRCPRWSILATMPVRRSCSPRSPMARWTRWPGARSATGTPPASTETAS